MDLLHCVQPEVPCSAEASALQIMRVFAQEHCRMPEQAVSPGKAHERLFEPSHFMRPAHTWCMHVRSRNGRNRNKFMGYEKAHEAKIRSLCR